MSNLKASLENVRYTNVFLLYFASNGLSVPLMSFARACFFNFHLYVTHDSAF